MVLTALHQIHHVILDDIPEDVLTHIVSEVVAGALGGAILFVVVSCLRRWLALSEFRTTAGKNLERLVFAYATCRSNCSASERAELQA
jgi:hypothetical protein